jgi:hypothetical protein
MTDPGHRHTAEEESRIREATTALAHDRGRLTVVGPIEWRWLPDSCWPTVTGFVIGWCEWRKDDPLGAIQCLS